MHKCSVPSCHKYYHLQCVNTDKVTRQGEKTCGYHLCRKCGLPGESKHMVQCFRCPTAFHNQCMSASLPKISKKFMLCEKHKAGKESKAKRPVSKNGLIIKLQLNEKEELGSEDFKIKKGGLRRDTGKAKKKKEEKRQPTPNYLSYPELGIGSPSSFDYDSYDKDWCKYCGSRFSSNFTKGPWGPRTLCTVHYIEWNQKKKLNLDSYTSLPTRPIDLSQNTELDFVNKARLRNPQYDPE